MDSSINPPARRRTIPPKGVGVKSSSAPTRGTPRLTPVGSNRRRIPPPITPVGNSPPPFLPSSPRDKTPVIIDGEEIKREDIPPITFPDPPPEETAIRPASPEKSPTYTQNITPELPPIEDDNYHTDNTQTYNNTIVDTSREDIINTIEDIITSSNSSHDTISSPEDKNTADTSPPSPKKSQQKPPKPPRVASKKSSPPPPPKKKKAPPPPPPKKKAPPQKLPVPDFPKMDYEHRMKMFIMYKGRMENLRNAFPGLSIPLIPEDTIPTPENLLKIHNNYDGYLTHVLISDSVGESMIVLVLVLGGLEFFLTKVVGLPASGYFLKQLKLITKYRAILYEIGEEKLLAGGGRSPPLARLMYLILLTSIATIGVRLLESSIGKTGASLAEDAIYAILGGGGADAPSGDPTENSGGFNLNSIMKMAGTFFGGNNSGQQGTAPPNPSSHAPPYNE